MKGLVILLIVEYFTRVLGCTSSVWMEIGDNSNGQMCHRCIRDPSSLPFVCEFSDELCKALVCKTYCDSGNDEYVNEKSFYYKNITEKVISACNRGYTFVEDIGLLYRIVVPGKSRDISMEICRNEGASLLLVNSEGIFNHVQTIILASGGGPIIANSPEWGFIIDGKYENGKWLDGSNKEITQYFWDNQSMPMLPYEGTCMVATYTSNGPWVANRNCNTEFAILCQIAI